MAVAIQRPEAVILPEDMDIPQLDLNILQLDMDILLADTNILPADTGILPPDGVPRTDIIVDDRFQLCSLITALTYWCVVNAENLGSGAHYCFQYARAARLAGQVLEAGQTCA